MKKQLTLEHLAPYLPYGLRIYNIMDKSIVEMSVESEIYKYERKTELNGIASIMVVLNINTLKPILRPLSDLRTEDYSEMTASLGLYTGADIDFVIGAPLQLQYNDLMTLVKNDFDVFDLLSDGLAININDLNK